jgi:hypothetical protein
MHRKIEQRKLFRKSALRTYLSINPVKIGLWDPSIDGHQEIIKSEHRGGEDRSGYHFGGRTMILSTNGNLWAIAGVIYALAGAVLICNALFLTPTPGNTSTADGFALRRQYEQWLDYRVGAALIAIGFFLQATGAFGSETLRVPAAFVLLGLCLAAAYYGFMKGPFVENLILADEKLSSDKPLALVRPLSPQPASPAPTVVVPLAPKADDIKGVAG